MQPLDEATSAVSLRRQIEVPQDALGQPGNVFQKHRLPLAVRSHHQIVKAERKFDDGIESGKRAVARPHFLHDNAAVAGAEYMDHAPGQNRFGKPVRRLIDGVALRGHGFHQLTAFGKIIFARRHARAD